MVDTASSPGAEQALRQLLQHYRDLHSDDAYRQFVQDMAAALNVACEQHLGPQLGLAASKLTFGQKVQALAGEKRDVVARAEAMQQRLNHYRRPTRPYPAEHVRVTAAGLVDVALALWDDLFPSSPPLITAPAVSGRTPLTPAPSSTARPGRGRLPWPAIGFAAGLVIVIALLGGFFRRPPTTGPAGGSDGPPVLETVAQPAATGTATSSPTATIAAATAEATPSRTPAITASATPTASPPPPTAAPTDTPAPTPTPLPPATSTPVPDSTPGPPATSAGLFAIGDRVQVQTGGPGLHARSGPGLDQIVLASMADGTELVVVGGPQEADGFIWWELQNETLRGWSAQTYLILAAP